MVIRPAVPGDASGIAAVHVLGWQVGYRGLLPQALLDGLDASSRVPRWAAAIDEASWPRRTTLVAVDGEQVLGFAHLRPTADADADPAEVGQIASFYVRPSTWRRGVGRELMTGAVRTLRSAAYRRATLWVLDTNAAAIGFYSALGWTADGSVQADVVLDDVTIQELRYRRDV